MKAIRILLCIVLSLAMALGMAGAYAEPLAAGTVTLRNVVLTLNGEEYALNQQVRIQGSADESSAGLRFELLNGDKVLLPLAGEIDETGVRFTLDDSGRVYAADMEMILQMMELDEEALAMLQFAMGLIESGAAAMEALVDPANTEALGKLLDGMASALVGAPAQEVEMDINGSAYAGVQYKGGVSVNNAIAELDIAANSGIAEWDAFVKQILDILAMSLGVEVSSFADLKAMMLEAGLTEEELAEELMNFDMTIGGDDDVSCVRAEMTLLAETAGMDMVIGVEEIVTADAIDILLSASAGDGEEEAMEMTVSGSAAFDGEVVTDMDLLVDCYGANVYTYEDGYVDSSSVGISYAVNGFQEDGLWNSTVDVGFANEYSYGYEDDLEVYTQEVGASAEIAETRESDGSITAAVAAAAVYGDQEYGLSFEVNRAEGAGLNALVGENSTVYTLTDDMEDVAYTLLSADAMGLMADVMELSADETIVRLGEKITEIAMTAYADYGYEDEYYYDDEYSYDDGAYDEYEDEYGDYDEIYTTVYSFEEAAEIYPNLIPAYTAPEGYTLSYIDVCADDLYAEYVTADGYDYIGLYVIDFGMDMGNEVAYYDDGMGGYVGAEVLNGSTYVSFYFAADSQAEAEAIVAGLSF